MERLEAIDPPAHKFLPGIFSKEAFYETTSSGAATSNSFVYTGRELDATGLYFYRARYYNPQLQRFISEDPIGFNGGDVNLYAYVWNSTLVSSSPRRLQQLPHTALARQ